MLRIRHEIEDWREGLAGRAPEGIDDDDLEAWAAQLRDLVLSVLDKHDVEHEVAHRQSLGSFELLQPGGTENERAEWHRIYSAGEATILNEMLQNQQC